MDTVVRTQLGAVRGATIEGIAVFKGIPYAASPFGARRFQPPQPVEAWNGVRDALTYGATVTKPPYFPPFDVLLPEPAIAGEDCLNLNIWTPDPGKAGLPVMVWIHGGAFANGTARYQRMMEAASRATGWYASLSTIAWAWTASSSWDKGAPISVCLIRLLPLPGYRRTSRPLAAIQITSRSLVNLLAG